MRAASTAGASTPTTTRAKPSPPPADGPPLALQRSASAWRVDACGNLVPPTRVSSGYLPSRATVVDGAERLSAGEDADTRRSPTAIVLTRADSSSRYSDDKDSSSLGSGWQERVAEVEDEEAPAPDAPAEEADERTSLTLARMPRGSSGCLPQLCLSPVAHGGGGGSDAAHGRERTAVGQPAAPRDSLSRPSDGEGGGGESRRSRISPWLRPALLRVPPALRSPDRLPPLSPGSAAGGPAGARRRPSGPGRQPDARRSSSLGRLSSASEAASVSSAGRPSTEWEGGPSPLSAPLRLRRGSQSSPHLRRRTPPPPVPPAPPSSWIGRAAGRITPGIVRRSAGDRDSSR